MLDTFRRDLRHGARMLAKNPGFAAVAMLSIAVGVGANAAMFSVADGLVLRPLPVTDSSRIVTVMATSSGIGFRNPNLSYPEYVDIRDQSRSFDAVVAYAIFPTSYAIRREDTAQRKVGMFVSGNMFDAMGVRPQAGRGFRADEDRPGQPGPVVVLDHDEWARSFGSSPDVVGTTIRIGGAELTVVGVAPRGFTGIDHDVHPSFYVPLSMWTTVLDSARPDDLVRRDGRARQMVVKARVRPGLTVEEARADVGQIAANLTRAYPDTNQGRGFTARTQLDALNARPGGGDGPLVMMLMTLAFAVLLVACANVGVLLVSRAPARARDIAMRLAIGAGRPQVVRQLMTEGVLMAAGGAAIGLVLAFAAIGAFQRLEFPTDFPLKLTFYRGFAFELAQGPGFRTDHLLMVALQPGLARYDQAKSVEFYRELKERAQTLPGVRSATITSSVPMKVDTFQQTPVAPEGFQFPPGTENVPTLWVRVDEHYFETMGVPLVSGRPIRSTDTAETPAVAIVNETMAQRYWPGQNVLGKRVQLDQRDRMMVEIVGVAADSTNAFIGLEPLEMMYVPRLQHPIPQGTLLLHTDGPAAAMAGPVRELVRSLDPDMPVFGVRTMEDFYYMRATYIARLIAGSVGVMGAMGVGLAVVGLYGVVAYTASRRTREIGIRMAIGAQPASVLRMVLRHGLTLTLCGLAVGAAGALAAGRLLPSVLSGLQRGEGGIDVAPLAIVVPILGAVTMLATYLPARRASRIDPFVALRQE